VQSQELSTITGLPESGSRPAGLWKMPIWFEVHYSDGSVDRKQSWIENQTEIVRIPNSLKKKVDFVLFDPNNEVMKSVTFDKSFDMLRSQALKAKYMLDRYDAIAAMKKIDIEKKRDFLIQQFDKETFQAVKSEIVNQLIGDANPKSYGVIRKAISDKDVPVRKNVLAKTKTIPAELLSDYEKLLRGGSYDLIAAALEKLSYQNPSKTQHYLELTKGVENPSGQAVKIKWLEIASSSDEKYLAQLVSYTSQSYEFRTRANAFAALRRLNYMNKTLLENTCNALGNGNWRLSGAARETMKYFYAQNSYKKIIDDYVASNEWAGWHKARILSSLN
jgi:hypothetical protein